MPAKVGSICIAHYVFAIRSWRLRFGYKITQLFKNQYNQMAVKDAVENAVKFPILMILECMIVFDAQLIF